MPRGPSTATPTAIFSNRSVTHTNIEAKAWWQVDLGAIHEIGQVILYNRTDCCSERLANFGQCPHIGQTGQARARSDWWRLEACAQLARESTPVRSREPWSRPRINPGPEPSEPSSPVRSRRSGSMSGDRSLRRLTWGLAGHAPRGVAR